VGENKSVSSSSIVEGGREKWSFYEKKKGIKEKKQSQGRGGGGKRGIVEGRLPKKGGSLPSRKRARGTK